MGIIGFIGFYWGGIVLIKYLICSKLNYLGLGNGLVSKWAKCLKKCLKMRLNVLKK